MTSPKKLNFVNIIKNIQPEREIIEYKEFYKKYFMGLQNRNTILKHLAALNQKMALKKNDSILVLDNEYNSLVKEGKDLVKKYFPPQLLSIYEKPLPPPALQNDPEFNNTLIAILNILVKGFESMRVHNQQDFNYKKNLLAYVYGNILHHGLHPIQCITFSGSSL